MTHLPPAMCARCLALLGEGIDDGVLSYGHPSDDGHTPEPIPVDLARARIGCDFCRDEVQLSTGFTVPFEDYTVAVMFPGNGTLTNSFRGDWCACPACAHLIQGGDWEGLIDRVLASLNSDRQDPVLVSFLTETYGGLRSNATGPIRPYQLGDGPIAT